MVEQSVSIFRKPVCCRFFRVRGWIGNTRCSFSKIWSKIFGDFEVCEKCGSLKVKHRICKECYIVYTENVIKERLDKIFKGGENENVES
ncbi:hypothetical protein LCGC14_1953930 [marine sediment metagenome]|uniref:50S ribosomal protein L32 n=1 Tax=marine sediment metagenome TaxID=412755 RepID=A0A0F9IDN9_9ZZZZ